MIKGEEMVLACVDGSALLDPVCDYASWVTQRLNAPLKLLHTIDHHHETALKIDLSGNIGVDSRDHLLEEITDLENQKSKLRLQEGKLILKAANARVTDNGIDNAENCLQHGSLIDSLIELEERIGVLVIGARGKIHEQQTDQIGAKLEAMIRSLHRPILIAYDQFKMPQRIMVAYDGREAAQKAVDMVAVSPLFEGLTCHLVCVGKNNKDDSLMKNALDKLRQSGDIEVICTSLQGKVDEALCDYQLKHDIDITVMGAFSHTRIHDFLLGSVTLKMLLNTKRPLLLLR